MTSFRPSVRPMVHCVAMAFLVTLTGCGGSEPVSDIPNSQMIDVNAVDLDPGTMGDASAVEAMGRADADMTGVAPVIAKPAALSTDNAVNSAQTDQAGAQTASVHASSAKSAGEDGNAAGPQ